MEEAQIKLSDVKRSLVSYIGSMPDFSVIRISEDCFAVTTKPNNLSSLDFVHVTRKGCPPAFVCAFGSRCNRVCVTVAKKTKTFSSCPHEQFVKIICEPGPETENVPATSQPEQPDVPSPFSDNPWLENTSKYRYNHQKIKFDETEMKTIEKEIIRLYKSDDGFPSLYQVNKRAFYHTLLFNLHLL